MLALRLSHARLPLGVHSRTRQLQRRPAPKMWKVSICLLVFCDTFRTPARLRRLPSLTPHFRHNGLVRSQTRRHALAVAARGATPRLAQITTSLLPCSRSAKQWVLRAGRLAPSPLLNSCRWLDTATHALRAHQRSVLCSLWWRWVPTRSCRRALPAPTCLVPRSSLLTVEATDASPCCRMHRRSRPWRLWPWKLSEALLLTRLLTEMLWCACCLVGCCERSHANSALCVLGERPTAACCSCGAAPELSLCPCSNCCPVHRTFCSARSAEQPWATCHRADGE